MSSWVTMNIWVTELPKAPSLTTLRFTTIVMSERSLSIDTQPRTIIQFLSACPELETCQPPRPAYSALPEHLRHAFPSLLYRRSTANRALPRPSQRRLPVPQRDYFTESGDSDDEANDFSRSKWSDHATGMGLRRLILRSHPPLKVLDMDWSDMRTKDFKFAFQHLDQLETFFIAASDMSDKVIELFRPYVSRDGSRRVCLPRLKSLELANCNELSGAVLLDVLSARVKLTDNLPGAESLTAVTISECPSFTERHAQLLRKDLGDRLRLDLD
ncbi:hypothetical protein B0H10DRAFT_2216755 [Mycena sp. CBHHK59/15]|nr:hypothetical protein B0H10DRAFT_2216755 [Mycena sp. CBHHK59/15]